MKPILWSSIFLALISIRCEQDREPVRSTTEISENEEIPAEDVALKSKMDSSLLAMYSEFGLVEVEDSRIIVDLRYTTDNNFMGTVLYDTIDRLFLQEGVSTRLSLCQDYLDSICPGFRIKVFDGVRPLQVQREMWEALDSIPPLNRGKFVSNPIFGSVHNFGTAVDVTICDENGKELDMGAGYDDFRPIAFPSREAHFLKTGELSKVQWENRKLLRKVMRTQKFYNIPSEWWHFNAFSRITCEKKFEILLTESGDHRWWVSPKIKKDSLSDGDISADSTSTSISLE